MYMKFAFTGNFGWTEVRSMTELPYVGLCGNSYFGFWRRGRCGRSFAKVSSCPSVFWVHHPKLVLVNFSMSDLSFTSGISPTSSLVYDLCSKIREIFTTWNRLQPLVSYFSYSCPGVWAAVWSLVAVTLTSSTLVFFLYLGSCRKDLLYLYISRARRSDCLC